MTTKQGGIRSLSCFNNMRSAVELFSGEVKIFYLKLEVIGSYILIMNPYWYYNIKVQVDFIFSTHSLKFL